MKKVEIKYKTVKVPEEIKVDGKIYPSHGKNWEIIRKYEATKDENVLEDLVDFSLDF